MPSFLSAGAWADDFFHPHMQPQPVGLVSRVLQVTTAYVEQADSIGMQLTFAKDKTAALFHLPMLPPEESAQFSTGPEGPALHGTSAVTGQPFTLPVVQAYKHLGGIITGSGTPAPEIGYRSHQAWALIRPLRTRLFAAVSIPLPIRCHLLRSLAASRFVFGCAVLRLHAAVHFRAWARAYVAMWRALHKPRPGEKSPHAYLVLHTAAAPSPPLSLALARAVLLRQVVARGPATLRHLLWRHWEVEPHASWLGQVVQDVKHTAQYSDAAKVLLQSRSILRDLVEAVQERPTFLDQAVERGGPPVATRPVPMEPGPTRRQRACQDAHPCHTADG